MRVVLYDGAAVSQLVWIEQAMVQSRHGKCFRKNQHAVHASRRSASSSGCHNRHIFHWSVIIGMRLHVARPIGKAQGDAVLTGHESIGVGRVSFCVADKSNVFLDVGA
jgi:hypothetical protein